MDHLEEHSGTNSHSHSHSGSEGHEEEHLHNHLHTHYHDHNHVLRCWKLVRKDIFQKLIFSGTRRDMIILLKLYMVSGDADLLIHLKKFVGQFIQETDCFKTFCISKKGTSPLMVLPNISKSCCFKSLTKHHQSV